jgi:hypothetical protein
MFNLIIPCSFLEQSADPILLGATVLKRKEFFCHSREGGNPGKERTGSPIKSGMTIDTLSRCEDKGD